jgi:hypothetical protein
LLLEDRRARLSTHLVINPEDLLYSVQQLRRNGTPAGQAVADQRCGISGLNRQEFSICKEIFFYDVRASYWLS